MKKLILWQNKKSCAIISFWPMSFSLSPDRSDCPSFAHFIYLCACVGGWMGSGWGWGQGHGAAATLPVSIDLLYCSASFYISESYNSKIKNKTY